ncbi:exo-beta-N-acetylmuramidase NamZ domain-containing protein [Fimbriimonas ginsengisoli]|uniref:YzbB n=1 Tax=Fimbriimonas ginsengisoli Gsoil 348 TaxID=661478 RepID=A0A068NR83_FIMGI|nr:exo-beta-N-acetylmuramidase NamZ domain-containing protein [Fimbriimonas ginsengisoli]AIE85951.1 YzbB [Fimbriimonas ginsengisoli Gsoil 348]
MPILAYLALAASIAAPRGFAGAEAMDRAIASAMAEGRMPGAVLLVGHKGHVVYRKAYGYRSLVPTKEPMTTDTVFDLASLTKVVATTSCLMKLYEEGRFRLNDRVTDYLPEFQGGKSDITLRELMIHFSGLRSGIPRNPEWEGYKSGIYLAESLPPVQPPDMKNVYSDINFILLGEIVQRLSGKSLPEYSQEQIFRPLGMRETTFLPPPSWLPRIAPTERPKKDELPLRGVVHDPTARSMGGAIGSAGLFSTADDLSRFAQMMLNGGSLRGHRLFSPFTVTKFTEPQTPPDQPILRGLGWDIDSAYSSNRGELFPIGSFGHTGFTGTSIWIDPFSQSYVILLANAVHPDGGKSLVPLRRTVGTIAAAALGIKTQRVALTGYNELMAGNSLHREIFRNGSTLTGLDVLENERFTPFLGKRIGLITNHTGRDREGRRNIDVMRASGVNVAALFSPEHGMAGKEDRSGIGDAVDPDTGVKVYSLYGDTLRPTPEMLKGLEALVFDIQDVGVRFYTYETTMAYAMEAAAKAKIPFYVLDRPNPITGTRVEGPPLDEANASFVGYFPGMPVRHGMTMGELAKMFNEERSIGADLTVVPMQDWQRGDWYDSTSLGWINPSPNMRSLKAAILYPGVCLIEFGKNISVGRGTDSPFEQFGADFVNGRELSAYLNMRDVPGVRFYPTSFTPTESRFQGVHIEGVRIEIVDRGELDSVRLGLEIACALQHLYPGKVDWSQSKRLIGSDDTIRRIAAAEDPIAIQQSFRDPLNAFAQKREKYLIYGHQ